MDDLISRQAAIDALGEEPEVCGVAHRNGDGCILNVADSEYDYISYTAK